MNPTNTTTPTASISQFQPTTVEIITMEVDEESNATTSSDQCDSVRVVNAATSSSTSPKVQQAPQKEQFEVQQSMEQTIDASQSESGKSASNLTQILCIEQVESDFTPMPWKSASQRGQFCCEKDEVGRFVIRQPPELDYLFQFAVGILSLFIVPCFGFFVLLSIYWTMEFNMILSGDELILNTFGAFWKNKRLETSMSVPIRNIAVFKVVMNQAQKKDGLPDGKLFILTRDNLTIEVQKDFVNYYSVLAMAQKATELINAKLNLV